MLDFFPPNEEDEEDVSEDPDTYWDASEEVLDPYKD